MCVWVINGTDFDNKAKIINSIINKFSMIKTIVLNINTDNTNVIMGKNRETSNGWLEWIKKKAN